jgi:hypothetical protein
MGYKKSLAPIGLSAVWLAVVWLAAVWLAVPAAGQRKPAPEFRLEGTGRRPVQLSRYKGKVVLLRFIEFQTDGKP